MSKVLIHYQIKGAKHGVRRYQNEDGSWTSAGRARYGKSGAPNLGTSNLTNIVKRQKMETEYEKANPTTEQKRQKEIDTIGKEAMNIDRESLKIGTGPKTKTITKDYSHVSNEELKSRIERLNLESNYGRLSGDTKMVRSGSDWFREIMQTGGALVAIGTSAVALYGALKKLKTFAPAVAKVATK